MRRFVVCWVLSVVISWNVGAAENDSSQPIDFDTQVVPVLTRFGCNAGACHGAAVGRGGFRLSLFGSRPQDDYESIVRELEGRRINLAHPESSLLLRKATESMEHGGGERFAADSDAYEILYQWLTEQSPRLQRRKLLRLEYSPTSMIVKEVDQSVPVRSIATYSDGMREDVTGMTVLSSDDEEAVSVDRDSEHLIPRRRGEHFVIARFLDRVQAIRITVPIGTSDHDPGRPSENDRAEESLIDSRLVRRLGELRIPISPAAEDGEYARRVWLDLAGRLPTLEELEGYVEDDRADKKSRLVDRLLDSDDFAAYWSMKWAGVLAIDSKTLQPQGAEAYHEWIRTRFRSDSPWNETARAMLTASGDSFVNGPANFMRSASGADGVAEAATRIFMGVRLRCANCHDHPLDHWNQDDYHGLAAIFARVQRGRVVSDAQRGEVTHPVTGQAAIPRIPGERFLDVSSQGRKEFAEWVTDASNPYFARAAVNRIWAQLMGRGLIDPVDDLRSTNPPSHPDLLNDLESVFVECGFRFRPIIRMICLSDAYGRSSSTRHGNEADTVYYSHFVTRPLEAEVIANAIADVTGVAIRYTDADETISTDAIRLTDNRIASQTLDVLGRCDREEGCETIGGEAKSLSSVLHFLNGDLLNRRLADPDGWLVPTVRNQPDDTEMVTLLYRRLFCRPPSAAEAKYWVEQIEIEKAKLNRWVGSAERHQLYVDIMWAMLTSESFLSNH